MKAFACSFRMVYNIVEISSLLLTSYSTTPSSYELKASVSSFHPSFSSIPSLPAIIQLSRSLIAIQFLSRLHRATSVVRYKSSVSSYRRVEMKPYSLLSSSPRHDGSSHLFVLVLSDPEL